MRADGRTGGRIKARWFPAALLVCAGLALGLLVYVILMLHSASNRITDLDAGRATQDAQINGLAGAVSSARAQIQGLGATPVVPAPSKILETISVSGAQGPQGPGPSDAQVAAAVSAYLQAHPVPGVSSQQVATAVDAYFAASPAPSGPQGPGPSQQQIADAVASYMAANPAPSGPAGPVGSPGVGATGPQGPAGSPGQNGGAGSPPAGWNWTDPSGNEYSCVQDNQTPAPHYTCTAVPSPSPSTSTSTSTASPSGTATVATAPRPSTPASTDVTATASDPTRPTQTPTAPQSSGGPSLLAWLIGVPFYRRGL